MSKKKSTRPAANKIKLPAENKIEQLAENKIEQPEAKEVELPLQEIPQTKKVYTELLPGRGIGGIGGPGTQAWMDEAEAKQYEADGYVRILPEQPVIIVPSVVPPDEKGQ